MTSRLKTASTGLTRRGALGAAAAFAATLPAIRPARAAVELRLTHPADLSHPVHIEGEAMVKRIAERTNGEVKITIFPNNALGSPVEAAQQTRLGAIDMMLLNPANIEALSKTIGVINIPYQFDSYEHAHKTLDVTARDWIAEQLKAAGFVWIANFEWGFPRDDQQPPADQPARRRPRVSRSACRPNSRSRPPSRRSAPRPRPSPSRKFIWRFGQQGSGRAGQSGRHDIRRQILRGAEASGADPKHIYASIMFCSNPRSWSSKLNEAQRKIVQEEGAESRCMAARKGVRDNEEANLAAMQKAGVEITQARRGSVPRQDGSSLRPAPQGAGRGDMDRHGPSWSPRRAPEARASTC